MDVLEAAWRVAHDYQAGVQGLAAKLGKHPGTFANELNPGQEGHKLGLGDATAMQAVAGDHRILHAMAHTLGEVCFAVPDLGRVSDEALLQLTNKIGAEGGDFHRAVDEALRQHRFTRQAYGRVQEEAMQYIAAIAEALARLEGLVDE